MYRVLVQITRRRRKEIGTPHVQTVARATGLMETHSSSIPMGVFFFFLLLSFSYYKFTR